MNHFAIELNNNGVKELQSGRLCKSLETISLACRIIAEQHHEHTNMNPGEYKFHWTDCKHDAFETHSQKAKSANEPFLYLHFLRISAPHKKEQERNKEKFCPCGFAWAIWYNMALIYTIAGLATGEKGRDFLQCADSYLGHVKLRTEQAPGDCEKNPSKDWCRLQIAVLNNQVCISNELCMHKEAQGQLFEMQQRISSAYNVVDIYILEEFALNLQCLLRSGDLASAA